MPKRKTRLRQFYDCANRVYFGGNLPSNTLIVWDRRMWAKDRCVGMMESCPGLFTVIRISTTVRHSWALVAMVMFHEMVHVFVFHKYGKRGANIEHGKKFQAEMLRLARLGAFQKFW